MNSFAKETRHREHQLDEVPLKFICTQLPSFIDYKHVYPFIANDMESINFRAPGVLDTYANMRLFNPKLLSDLINSPDNLKVAQNVPLFKDFIEKVKPPKGKELSAFFSHRKNLSDHVDALTEDFDERKRLFEAIKTYQVPKHMDMRQAVISIGTMLNEWEILGGEAPQDFPQEEEEEENLMESSDESPEINLPINDPSHLNDEDYWENPVLKAFKIDAGLSTRFSTDKTVKQILIRSCAPNMVDHLELGKHQKDVPAVREVSFEHFPTSYIDHLPTETISKMVPYCDSLYHGLTVKPVEGRELVKTYLTIHNPELSKFVQVSKNFKLEPIDPNFITLLLDASSCSHQA